MKKNTATVKTSAFALGFSILLIGAGSLLSPKVRADLATVRIQSAKLMQAFKISGEDSSRFEGYEVTAEGGQIWLQNDQAHRVLHYTCDAVACVLASESTQARKTPATRMLFADFALIEDQLPVEALRVQERAGITNLADKITAIKLWKEGAALRIRLSAPDQAVFLQCHSEAHEGEIGAHCHYRGQAGSYEPGV